MTLCFKDICYNLLENVASVFSLLFSACVERTALSLRVCEEIDQHSMLCRTIDMTEQFVRCFKQNFPLS